MQETNSTHGETREKDDGNGIATDDVRPDGGEGTPHPDGDVTYWVPPNSGIRYDPDYRVEADG